MSELKRATARLAAALTQLEKASAELEIACVSNLESIVRLAALETLRLQGRAQVILEHLTSLQDRMEVRESLRKVKAPRGKLKIPFEEPGSAPPFQGERP